MSGSRITSAMESQNIVKYKYLCTCGAGSGIYSKTVYMSPSIKKPGSSSVGETSAEELTLRKKYEHAIFENKEQFKSRTRLLERDHLDDLDDKDRLVSSLRKIVVDLERQFHDQDNFEDDMCRSRTESTPVQRLIDQIEHLQKDKQKLRRLLSEFKVTGSIESLLDSPFFQTSPAKDQPQPAKDQHQPAESIHIQTEKVVNSEVHQCSTDTEKVLEQTIRQKQTLESEVLQLRRENTKLRLQVNKLKIHDVNQNFQKIDKSPGTPYVPDTHVVPVSNSIPQFRESQPCAKYVNSKTEPEETTTKNGISPDQIATLEQQIKTLTAEVQIKNEALEQARSHLKHEISSLDQDKEAAIEEFRAKMTAEVARLSSSFSSLAGVATSVCHEFRQVKDSYLALRAQMVGVPLSLGSYMMCIQQQIQQSLSQLASTNQEVVQKYLKEMKLRKKYHNRLVELRGNIRVLCRVRPCIPEDEATSESDLVLTPDPHDDGVIKVNFKSRVQSFDLDRVFGLESTQEQVFDEVSALVRSVIDGFNVCIFAYGQTGSGKTYTMEGPYSNPGINQRSLQLLFEETKDANWHYDISASVMEIYNEAIRDLLNPDPSNRPEVKMRPEGGFHVPGLESRHVASLEEVNQVFQTGRKNRATACTNMNEHSSRSHCLLCIAVKGVNSTTGTATFGRLNLVDLAGSERVSKSHADGARLKEAQNINRSLASLGDVIHALRSKRNHVPYRNSKLTYLLQDSLGGDSKTMMIVQVSPVEKNVAESLCTLSFGQRVKSVKLGQATRSVDGGTAKTNNQKPDKRRSRPASFNFSLPTSLSNSFCSSSASSSHNSSFVSSHSSLASSPSTSFIDDSPNSSPVFVSSPVFFTSSTTSSPSPPTSTCTTPTPQSPRLSTRPPKPSSSSNTSKKGSSNLKIPQYKLANIQRKSPTTPNQGQGLQRSATFSGRVSSTKK